MDFEEYKLKRLNEDVGLRAAYEEETASREAERAELREAVTLKNGAVEYKGLVVITMLTLRQLGPIELYELVALCRDPSHRLWGGTTETLETLGLLDGSGQVHDSIRNIVLSSAKGTGLQLHFESPYAEQEEGEQ